MEAYFYIGGGLFLLIVFPLRYVYIHYLRRESHVMVITHHYQSHWLLEIMRKVAFAIAFFGSCIVSILSIAYGLKILLHI
ncbi:MAG: hypothetical protein RI911_40 [Candidatus Parcubacteria bacterium]|jgi:hypothetical protein